jgi:hypothetical protein
MDDTNITHDKDGNEVYVGLSKYAPPIDYLKMYYQGRLPKLKEDTLLCETQLLTLGDMFPLHGFDIDIELFNKEINQYEDKWVPYLPRKDRVNNRFGLCLTGIEGDTYQDSLSMPEARRRHNKELFESDFSSPTQLYNDLTCLQPLLNYFSPLGRTFLVKSNEAGWFSPHRDGKWIARDTFRLIVFLRNCGPGQYSMSLDNKSVKIQEGKVYYINTRLEHHTFSMVDDSIRLIINVPVNLDNVLKLLTYA